MTTLTMTNLAMTNLAMTNLTMATTVEEAQAASGEIRAGGTDIMDRRRHHISHGDILDVSRIDGYETITATDNGGLNIGAMVKLDTVANDPKVIERYPGLAIASGALATPQIRYMATMGGVILQTTRCWYFRNEGFSNCFKKGGDHCPARDGAHRFGAVFDISPCVFPHPSTVGMVLMNYDAQVEINGSETRSINDIYGDGKHPAITHTLKSGELLTNVILPKPVADERAGYFRSISRARAEWALVEASVRMVVDDSNTITMARVAIGGVAHIPLLLPAVNQALEGQPATEATFEAAAKRAIEGVTPLPQTGYKVPLIYGTVFETLNRAYNRIWGGEG
ncbi:MAG: FAD binding domain-containing protein [Chloroflexota bacterium]